MYLEKGGEGEEYNNKKFTSSKKLDYKIIQKGTRRKILKLKLP